MSNKSNSPILVTGATGYIASHLIKILLENGHKVRGTVRSLAKKDKYAFLYDLVPSKKNNLSFVEAELTDKASWKPALEGVEYIFHMASPFPPSVPKDENEIIIPAIEGTLNVLEAAVEKKVKKAVITSSGLAIFVGNDGRVTDENDWSREEVCPPYQKSKLKAERAAWKFYEENKNKIEMTVVNPSMVLGPINARTGGATEILLSEMLKGTYPGVLDIKFSIVDVRDVALGHYKAMFNANTNGQRYALTGGMYPMESIISGLKKEFDKYGYEINDKYITKEEVIASGHPVAQRHVPMIGKELNLSNAKSVKELGMKYIPLEKIVVDMGYSLIKHGVVTDKTQSNPRVGSLKASEKPKRVGGLKRFWQSLTCGEKR